MRIFVVRWGRSDDSSRVSQSVVVVVVVLVVVLSTSSSTYRDYVHREGWNLARSGGYLVQYLSAKWIFDVEIEKLRAETFLASFSQFPE
jgi:hypothetical protein